MSRSPSNTVSDTGVEIGENANSSQCPKVFAICGLAAKQRLLKSLLYPANAMIIMTSICLHFAW